jgi:hypothetical protein
MKPILPILLCSFFLTAHNARAEAEVKKEFLTQVVQYARPVPSSVAHAIPVEGKSLFWGKLAAKPDEAPVGLHLYSLYARELKVARNAKCHLALDIFSLSPKPRLLNRIFLVYKYTWPPTTYGVSFTWLAPKTESYPVLVVKSFRQADYGPLGIEHYVAFPNGWGQRASVANLNFGRWRASDTLGQDNRLVLGEDDLLEIHASLRPAMWEMVPNNVERDYTFVLRWSWDLRDFAPHAENQTVIQRYFNPYQ